MSTGSLPATVYIVRHGEKLGDPSDDGDGIVDLSIRGSARAGYLPSLFVAARPEVTCCLTDKTDHVTAQYVKNDLSGPAPRFSTPAFIFATQTSKDSNRPIETITPTATALGLAINSPYSDGDFAKLANDITTGDQHAGAIVLICWHHSKIPDLAQALGVASSPPWPVTVFDRVWEIDYSGGSTQLQDHPQQLLYGDSAT